MSKEPRGYNSAKKKAKKWVQDPDRVQKLLNDSIKKAKTQKGAIAKFYDDLKILMQLVKSYYTGHYRQVSIKTIVATVAALIYFVNPFDIVPDFLIGIGFLDDATVLAYAMNRIKKEIDQFKVFLKTEPIEIEAIDD